MGALLDIVGSLAIRGAIILVVVSLTITLRDALYSNTSRMNTAQVLDNASTIMEKDIRQAGYDVTTAPAFLRADSNQMSFLSNINNGVGIVDTLQYLLARDPNDLDPNSQVRLLTRVVDGQAPMTLAKGVLTLRFTYLDSLGLSTADLNNIQSISVLMTLQDTYQTDSGYVMIRREFQIFPVNL
jgi:hypothetical protein